MFKFAVFFVYFMRFLSLFRKYFHIFIFIRNYLLSFPHNNYYTCSVKKVWNTAVEQFTYNIVYISTHF